MAQNPTKEKLIRVAEAVFHEKGFDGARMRDIAERASINKGLLHYYFRTKQKLFEKVFALAFGKMAGRINEILDLNIPLIDKLELFVDRYLDFLEAHPHLPLFVIHALNRRGHDFPAALLAEVKRPAVQQFRLQINEAVSAGIIRPVDPEQLMVHIIGMCIFPIVASPMIQNLMGKSKEEFDKLLGDRRQAVKQFLRMALLPEN